MESSTGFSLQRHIAGWMGKIQSEPAVTETDAEELKSHLPDIIDDMKAAGLDEEEAFWVASKRLGNSTDWGGEYRLENNPVIHMRRSVIILAGEQVYFLFYL